MNQPYFLRPHAEIQMAHDLLHRLMDSDFPLQVDDTDKPFICAQLHVLCWALGHDGELFGQTLQGVVNSLKAQGYGFGPVMPGRN